MEKERITKNFISYRFDNKEEARKFMNNIFKNLPKEEKKFTGKLKSDEEIWNYLLKKNKYVKGDYKIEYINGHFKKISIKNKDQTIFTIRYIADDELIFFSSGLFAIPKQQFEKELIDYINEMED